MTNQEIFDTVLHGLRAQGRASFMMYGGTEGAISCLYRGKDDRGNVTKCAAGMLIDDSDYAPVFENCPAGMIYGEGAYGGKLDYGQAAYFLADLQMAHDQELARESFSAWEAKMQTLASRYGLTYAHPPIL